MKKITKFAERVKNHPKSRNLNSPSSRLCSGISIQWARVSDRSALVACRSRRRWRRGTSSRQKLLGVPASPFTRRPRLRWSRLVRRRGFSAQPRAFAEQPSRCCSGARALSRMMALQRRLGSAPVPSGPWGARSAALVLARHGLLGHGGSELRLRKRQCRAMGRRSARELARRTC